MFTHTPTRLVDLQNQNLNEGVFTLKLIRTYEYSLSNELVAPLILFLRVI